MASSAKVSGAPIKGEVAPTNARAPGGQFVLHARALPGNPYDGHTLGGVIEDTEKLTGCPIERAYVDKGSATKPQPRGAYSSQARNVASSESSNASSGAAQPSSL